jgi:ribonuclease VapC
VIVDASALLAVTLRESDAPRYARAIAEAAAPKIPSVTWFEASLRIEQDGDAFAVSRFETFASDFRIAIIPFTSQHAEAARIARRRFGRPHHPARLNFGDCMVYGVAKVEREPLLYKGTDFSLTDIEPALRD